MPMGELQKTVTQQEAQLKSQIALQSHGLDGDGHLPSKSLALAFRSIPARKARPQKGSPGAIRSA